MVNKIRQAMNKIIYDDIVFARVMVFLVLVVAPIAFKVEEVLR